MIKSKYQTPDLEKSEFEVNRDILDNGSTETPHTNPDDEKEELIDNTDEGEL